MRRKFLIVLICTLLVSSYILPGSVSANADITPPRLMDITIENRTYSVGESIEIQMQIEEEHPSSKQYIYFKRPLTNDNLQVPLDHQGEGLYTATIDVTDRMQSGLYEVQTVQLFDTEDNDYYYRGTYEGAAFSIIGTHPDVDPPKLLAINIESREYGVGESVQIEMLVEEDHPSSRQYIYFKRPLTNDSYQVPLDHQGEGRYTATINVSDRMQFGLYEVQTVQLFDTEDNDYYYRGTYEGATFSIIGTHPDVDPPKLLAINIESREYEVDETVQIEMLVEEDHPSTRQYIYFKRPLTNDSYQVPLDHQGGGRYTTTINVTDRMQSGLYEVQTVQLFDTEDNDFYYRGTYEGASFRLKTDYEDPIITSVPSTEITLDMDEQYELFVGATDNTRNESIEMLFTHEASGSEKRILSTSISSEGGTASVRYDDFPEVGTWELSEVKVLDVVGNEAILRDGLDMTVTILSPIPKVQAYIVSGSEYWSNKTIDQDVYILPGALLTTDANVKINGNVYVGGRLRSYGGLNVSGEVRANFFTFGYYTPYQDGMVVMSGSNSVYSMTATNQLYTTLPFRLSETPVFDEAGTVSLSGSFIPLSTLYLNGQPVQAKANGTFRVTMETPEDKVLRFSMTDSSGKSHRWTYKVYATEAPTVSASLDSGIYLKGESVTLTTTDGTIYYAVSEEDVTAYESPLLLEESTTLETYAVDDIDRKSASLTRRYEVISLEDVTNDDMSIRGTAEPGTEVTVTLGHLPLTTTADAFGQFSFESLNLTKQTSFTIQASHGLFTSEVIEKSIEDVIPPTVEGVTDGSYSAEPVTLSFDDGTATLNGEPITSPKQVTEDGTYTLLVQDESGNKTTVRFTIDQIAPIITGVTDGYFNEVLTPTFNEGIATLNGESFISGQAITTDGEYTLIVRDGAGNETKRTFTIDRTAPVVTGVTEGFFNEDVTPVFAETATLNGEVFASGTVVSEEGDYTLVVTDLAGNETKIRFTIDRTPVTVSGVTNGLTNAIVTPTFAEGTATLNGQSFTSGQAITTDGEYTLIVRDEAGNETMRTFTIDRTAPVVTGVTEGFFNEDVTPVFAETATLNGEPFASGTVVSEEGDYTLVVTDLAGNETKIRFTIDKTKVEVTGVTDGAVYMTASPVFMEGKAELNGVPVVSGQAITADGTYELNVTDEAGNATVIHFTIDASAPDVTGFKTGETYYRQVTPVFSEGTATLNGQPYESGTPVTTEGTYTLEVVDAIGNKRTIRFTIDRTRPEISGVKSRQVTNQDVVIHYNEGRATLNGKRIYNNWKVWASGTYTLRVTDRAGNVSLLTFTIDKSAPSRPTVSSLTNKSTYVTGRAEKGATVYVYYNGRTYKTKAGSTGVYRYYVKTTRPGAMVYVRARDAAGNVSSRASTRVLNTFRSFSINSVKSTQTYITGKGNRGATVQAFVGSRAISKTARVDSRGNYKLYIPRQRAGVTVTVKMKQSGYQEMKKTTKVIR